jgi:HSP20 family molecular chaperone IbpA
MSDTATTPVQASEQQTPAPRGPMFELIPSVDSYENGEELLLLADVPGATAETVNVRIEDSVLTLQAQRAAANGRAYRYRRAFQVPDSVDPERITAELKHGVLHVHLGKAERNKRRDIAVRVA